MNYLQVGLDSNFENFEFPDGGFLFLHHVVPDLPHARRPVIFDPDRHHLNPCINVDYHYATAFVDAIDAAFSRADSTLTKDTGLDFILEALLAKPRSLQTLIQPPDKKSLPGHIWAYKKIQRILLSPTLRRVFDPTANQFRFNGSGATLAYIDPAKLTVFDALFLGLILIGRYQRQVIVPAFGFYGRNVHINLIRQNRLIAGLNYLDEVPLPLRRALLSIKDIHASGVQYQDAVELARHRGLRPDPMREDNEYNGFIDRVMA